MAKPKRVPWIKLYGDYSTTPSHAELDDRALWTGVALMQLIRAGCDARDDREPWALTEKGKPCTAYAIAQQARQPLPIAKRGLNLLVDAGTAALRDDGAFGMPNFWPRQETPDAARKRDERADKVRTVRPKSGRKSGVPLTREVRGESDSLRESPPSVPDAKPPDPHVEAAARVLARLNEHLAALGEPGKLTTTTWILALLRQRPDGEAECMDVLGHMAREAREIGTAKHLNPSTPFRPAHFETRLIHARAGAAKRPAVQPSLLSIAEIRQLEAEEDARATR